MKISVFAWGSSQYFDAYQTYTAIMNKFKGSGSVSANNTTKPKNTKANKDDKYAKVISSIKTMILTKHKSMLGRNARSTRDIFKTRQSALKELFSLQSTILGIKSLIDSSSDRQSTGLGKENSLSPPDINIALKSLGVSVTWNGVLTEAEATKILQNKVSKKITSVEQSFKWAKNEARDLWGWADEAAKICFKNLKITAPKAKGFGPAMNQEAQGQNDKTGVQCALLVLYGFVKQANSNKVFGGFDT